jgi:hypothetical protein
MKAWGKVSGAVSDLHELDLFDVTSNKDSTFNVHGDYIIPVYDQNPSHYLCSTAA